MTAEDDRLRTEIEAVPVHDMDDGVLNDEQTGQVIIRPQEDGSWDAVILKKPAVDDETARSFIGWARERLLVAMTIGPEADGWFRRSSDGGWQVTGRLVDMPPDPFD